jgi:endoglucanase
VTRIALTGCNSPVNLRELMLQNNTAAAQGPIVLSTLMLEVAGVPQNLLGNAQDQIRDYIKQAADWGKANQRPIFMGEFGAYSKADMASRVKWTSFTRSEAEKQGVSWGYWEFFGGFGIVNPQTKTWNLELRRALIP